MDELRLEFKYAKVSKNFLNFKVFILDLSTFVENMALFVPFLLPYFNYFKNDYFKIQARNKKIS